MTGRMAFLAVLLLAAALGARDASAKSVNIDPTSRSTMTRACISAHGNPYGIDDPDSEYGCKSSGSLIVCEPDGSVCIGYMSDIVPVRGSSIYAVLGTEQRAGPTIVAPVNAQVQPLAQPKQAPTNELKLP